MILHHYEISPFSEKIRLMFGYCDAQWQSAITPAMPPRDIVDPLAGGYRRIPVLQIGADIICDTKLISSELAARYNKPELSFETCGEEVAKYSHYVDTVIFMASIQAASPVKLLLTVFKLFSPIQGVRFIKDRSKFRRTSSVKKISREKASELLIQHFNNMESRLQSHPYLFGDSPTIADFSAYHNLWFSQRNNGAKPDTQRPNINRWLKAMKQFGHGQRSETNRTSVFAIAKETSAAPIPASMTQSEKIGKKIAIQPDDYAKISVSGTLVGEDDQRWIIARETQEFGTIHVHFPKLGFEITTPVS